MLPQLGADPGAPAPGVATNPTSRATARHRGALRRRLTGQQANAVAGRGSSPRMRGTLVDEWVQAFRPRFIPAHAGNTVPRRQRPCGSSVHPRACGEHVMRTHRSKLRDGSSPRMRATRLVSPSTPCCRRFIPAHAGNTAILSPIHHAGRFIPAHAGNTAPHEIEHTSQPVHPRACGEHSHPPVRRTRIDGSSPRMRGTRLRVGKFRKLERFIPAHAGNTSPPRSAREASPVHLRACGEHCSASVQYARPSGSSPRMRGTPVRPNITTPPAVHPRACGEH